MADTEGWYFQGIPTLKWTCMKECFSGVPNSEHTNHIEFDWDFQLVSLSTLGQNYFNSRRKTK